nr:MAG TPA: hypothetical protein [Caudoviricetes sp.]
MSGDERQHLKGMSVATPGSGREFLEPRICGAFSFPSNLLRGFTALRGTYVRSDFRHWLSRWCSDGCQYLWPAYRYRLWRGFWRICRSCILYRDSC